MLHGAIMTQSKEKAKSFIISRINKLNQEFYRSVSGTEYMNQDLMNIFNVLNFCLQLVKIFDLFDDIECKEKLIFAYKKAMNHFKQGRRTFSDKEYTYIITDNFIVKLDKFDGMYSCTIMSTLFPVMSFAPLYRDMKKSRVYRHAKNVFKKNLEDYIKLYVFEESLQEIADTHIMMEYLNG